MLIRSSGPLVVEQRIEVWRSKTYFSGSSRGYKVATSALNQAKGPRRTLLRNGGENIGRMKRKRKVVPVALFYQLLAYFVHYFVLRCRKLTLSLPTAACFLGDIGKTSLSESIPGRWRWRWGRCLRGDLADISDPFTQPEKEHGKGYVGTDDWVGALHHHASQGFALGSVVKNSILFARDSHP